MRSLTQLLRLPIRERYEVRRQLPPRGLSPQIDSMPAIHSQALTLHGQVLVLYITETNFQAVQLPISLQPDIIRNLAHSLQRNIYKLIKADAGRLPAI